MNSWLGFERRWCRVLLDATLPAAGGRPGLPDLDLRPFWLALEGAAPPLLRIGLRAATWVLTWLPLVLPGYFRPFFALDAERRDRFLLRAFDGKSLLLHEMGTVIKLISCLALFQDPKARAALGVEP